SLLHVQRLRWPQHAPGERERQREKIEQRQKTRARERDQQRKQQSARELPVFRVVTTSPCSCVGGTKDLGDRGRTTHDDTELELLEGALGPQPRCFMVILEGRSVLI
ncbi:unnamed protein product, partial [Ectocarpus sp. 8 AP-2014]